MEDTCNQEGYRSLATELAELYANHWLFLIAKYQECYTLCWKMAVPFYWEPKITERERERGYTDAQREAAIRAMEPEPTTWLRVVLDPWPNKTRPKY